MTDRDDEARALRREAARTEALREEVADLRSRVARHPREVQQLERRLAEARADARSVAAQNDRLGRTLSQAREKLVAMKAKVDALAEPPVSFGVIEQLAGRTPDDQLAMVDLFVQSRHVRTTVAPEIDEAELVPGASVLVNEQLVVVGIAEHRDTGEVMVLKERFDEGRRAVVVAHSDEELVVRLGASLEGVDIKPGDLLLVDRRTLFGSEKVPKLDIEELVLEEVPDVDYAAVGGLSRQIEQIQDAVELPFLHADLYRKYHLTPPKGILLYGPPGCGKTMIAKAVANSLASKVREQTGQEGRSYFLNVKGPELLNKYVGETERHIRLIFQRARAKAVEGMPVIVFFDEMDSLFRTRGSGVSSDVENTIVPQLLSELDGVESLENVIIIGASNREDMIDPAILRPGRLDVKIKIERPDAEAAVEIFDKYLTADLPLHADDLATFGGDAGSCRRGMVRSVVEHMYAGSKENEFLEVTYANGDKEIMYFRDFASGAMIQNIVDRAKKSAIKDSLKIGRDGITLDHLLAACDAEFAENEDLPNTANPDDWARISGKKGERIVYIRSLFTSKQPTQKSVENATTLGQYL